MRTPFRLLMVSSTFPPVVGGIQTYAVELARRFAASCDELTVVAPGGRDARGYDRTLPFEVIRLPRFGEDLALSGPLPLAVIARRRHFDAAFCTHWAPAFATQRAGNIEHIYTAAHGKELLIRPLKRVRPAQRVYDRIRREALAKSSGFFPVSTHTAELLVRAGADSARITVVPNGVDPTRFAPRDAGDFRRALGVGSRKVLLTVARLVPRKGIDTVLEALPRIVTMAPDVMYLVVGDGPDRRRLEDLARSHGIASHVRFLGAVRGDIVRYFNACDLFVMPAREEPEDVEGFGLVFLEAGACEKAVIGARAGGAVDAIHDGETGLLVPPNDPIALADAVIRLILDDVTRHGLGQRARARVVEGGTWDHAAQRILQAMIEGRAPVMRPREASRH